MSERMDMIIMLIKEEAKERPGLRSYVSKLYEVKYDVDFRIGAFMEEIKDRDRERKAMEGGE